MFFNFRNDGNYWLIIFQTGTGEIIFQAIWSLNMSLFCVDDLSLQMENLPFKTSNHDFEPSLIIILINNQVGF